MNLNLNVNLNEFVFYIHELAGASKKIFLKKKLLPDCNADFSKIKTRWDRHSCLSASNFYADQNYL